MCIQLVRQYLKRRRNESNPNDRPMMYQIIQSNHRKPRPVVVKVPAKVFGKRQRTTKISYSAQEQTTVPSNVQCDVPHPSIS